MSAAVLSVLVEQAKTKYILENPKSECHRSRLDREKATYAIVVRRFTV